VCLGFGIVYPSPAGASLSADLGFTKFERNIFNSIMFLNSLLGPPFASSVANRWGRRAALRSTALVCAGSWILLLLSPYLHKSYAIVHRAILGLSQSGYFTIIPVYIMELSPAERRAQFGSFHQTGVNLGCFLCIFIGAFISWRDLASVAAMVSIGQFLLSFFLPDSPVSNRDLSIRRKSLFRCEYLRPLLIGLLSFGFGQVSGITPIQFNLSQVMTSKMGPSIATSAQVIAGFFCAPLIRVFDRKVLWCLSCSGCTSSLWLLAHAMAHSIEGLAITSTFVFLFSFCVGLAPMPWFVVPELFDDEIRANAVGFMNMVGAVTRFCVTFMYSIVGDAIGYPNTFRIFGLITSLGIAFGIWILPEPQSYVVLPKQTS
jgi:MFS family permease